MTNCSYRCATIAAKKIHACCLQCEKSTYNFYATKIKHEVIIPTQIAQPLCSRLIAFSYTKNKLEATVFLATGFEPTTFRLWRIAQPLCLKPNIRLEYYKLTENSNFPLHLLSRQLPSPGFWMASAQFWFRVSSKTRQLGPVRSLLGSPASAEFTMLK